MNHPIRGLVQTGLFFCILAAALVPGRGYAADPVSELAPWEQPQPAWGERFRLQPESGLTQLQTADYVITGVSLAWWIVQGQLTDHNIAPTSCRWCATVPLDLKIRQRFLNRDRINAFRDYSDTGLRVLLGTAVLGTAGISAYSREWEPLFLAAESFLLAGSIDSLFKFSFARARPRTRDYKANRIPNASDLSSFTSGHATSAFALATWLTLVAAETQFVPGLVGVLGYGVAAFVGASRMGADRHWFTDIVGSAAIGTLAPTALWFLRKRNQRHSGVDIVVTPQAVAAGSGVQVGLRW